MLESLFNFIKKEFPYENCKIFKITYSEGHLRTTAAALLKSRCNLHTSRKLHF